MSLESLQEFLYMPRWVVFGLQTICGMRSLQSSWDSNLGTLRAIVGILHLDLPACLELLPDKELSVLRQCLKG